MICLTLSENTIEKNLRLVQDNRAYIDICELRIDFLTEEELPKAKEFPHLVDIPVILTYRRVQDGGQCTLPEKTRRNTLIHTLDGGFAYVDIEDDVKKNDVEEKAKAMGTKVIRSLHDFEGVPEDIFSKIHSMA
ncbi:MAG: type I 3-dehydroquinate dehydratase, partial [Spirochaetales bacterium]|nr:type I 3-dehydroquinate dehydratase [Candidatus Physcosoma equi]